MAGLRKLLGLFPNTEHYEKKRNELYDQYLQLNDIEKSDNYKRYLELDAYINSEAFKEKKKELLGLKYKKSTEFSTEKKYTKLAKRKDIKIYLQTVTSEDLKLFTEVETGKDLSKFNELKEFQASGQFTKVKDYHKLSGKKKFQQSDLNKTLQQYQQLEKQPNIKAYNKFTGNKNFELFTQVEKSDKLKRFEDLKEEVNSGTFQEQKVGMKKKEFKESELFEKLNEYKALSKDREIKTYFKLLKSSNYNYYKDLLASDELEAYNDMKSFINSDDFAKQKTEIESSKFEDTPEYSKLQEFEKLEKSNAIVHYFKFGKSKSLKIYNSVKDSSDLKEYETLKAEVEGDAFQKRKAFLTMNAKERYAESDENKKEQEYHELLSSDEIKFFLKNNKSAKYDWYRAWKPVFQDEFSDTKLNDKKWITKYYWGEKALNDSYSTEEEYQYITDGKNLEIEEKKLKIITRKETTKGKAWHPDFGFIPRDYDYTSGLVNSGDSFCQQYGAIEVKAKLTGHKSILEAVWLVSKDKKLPHIDLVTANSKTYMGYQWGDEDLEKPNKFYKKYGRGKFANKYFIFSIEWTAEGLVWKVNGDTVATQSKDIPSKEMYLLISSHLYQPVKDELLPSALEIDWVKCYQHVNYQSANS